MGSGNENSDDASRKRKKRSERGRERRCVYLDLHLGRNLRRLYENMKRGTRGREQGKKRKDRGQREAKTVSKNKKIKIEGNGREC